MKRASNPSWLSEQIRDPEVRRLFEQERLVVETTSALLRAMKEQSVSRVELAEKLGRSKSFVTQVLAGTRNMTLHTLADFAWSLGRRVQVNLGIMNDVQFRPLDLEEPVRMRATQKVLEPLAPGGFVADGGPSTVELAANSELAFAA